MRLRRKSEAVTVKSYSRLGGCCRLVVVRGIVSLSYFSHSTWASAFSINPHGRAQKSCGFPQMAFELSQMAFNFSQMAFEISSMAFGISQSAFDFPQMAFDFPQVAFGISQVRGRL